MKKGLLLLLFGFYLMSFTTFQNGREEMIASLKGGSADQFIKYFDNTIDIKMPNSDEMKGVPKAQAAVFILPRADVGETFWRNRIALYHDLAPQIPVVAVFAETEDAQPWRDLIKSGGLRTTLVERIPTVIQSIEGYAEREK